MKRLEDLSEKLEETNRQLRRAEADARRAERLAALGQLSAGLAHEIRNPLGVIKGSAEMLSRKVAGSEPLVAELAGYISSEVNRLNALVVRFLDFARPSKLELRPERISEIVDRALEAASASFPNANVKIERQYAPDLPEIPADRQLCEQVFVNLITNAFQAMESAGMPPSEMPENAAPVDCAGSLERRTGRRRDRRGFRPRRAARIARADLQSIFHVKERWSRASGFPSSRKSWTTIAARFAWRTARPRGARFHVFFPQAATS